MPHVSNQFLSRFQIYRLNPNQIPACRRVCERAFLTHHGDAVRIQQHSLFCMIFLLIGVHLIHISLRNSIIVPLGRQEFPLCIQHSPPPILQILDHQVGPQCKLLSRLFEKIFTPCLHMDAVSPGIQVSQQNGRYIAFKNPFHGKEQSQRRLPTGKGRKTFAL